MIAEILVADDDREITGLLAEHLSAKNHRVTVAYDGVQLFEKAVECRPHLIIADIQMPGIYGSSVYQTLQRDPSTSQIPVIFISAFPYESLKPILPEDAKTRFVPKPIALELLERYIQELLPMGGYVP